MDAGPWWSFKPGSVEVPRQRQSMPALGNSGGKINEFSDENAKMSAQTWAKFRFTGAPKSGAGMQGIQATEHAVTTAELAKAPSLNQSNSGNRASTGARNKPDPADGGAKPDSMCKN